MTKGVLYVCYQSITEPLTQTQVVAYLEGLAIAGYKTVLLTFEPIPLTPGEESEWGSRLTSLGLTWSWCRYHKRPTVPATAFDILVGVWKGLVLVRRHGVRLVHARGHVPGVMGALLKRLTNVKLLFDVRGLMAEEYVDAGVWPANGRLFHWTKCAERRLLKAADGVVVLTERARALFGEWYSRELTGKALEVVPCCVDLRRSVAGGADTGSVANGPPVLVYVGKIGGWYLTEEMVAFVAKASTLVPGLHWDVWTQSDPGPLRELVDRHGIAGRVSIGRTTPEALSGHLKRADAGLSFIKPCLSKQASSPTKVAEYLAAGLAVVSTRGIGDTDAVLTDGSLTGGGPVGVIVRHEDDQSYEAATLRLLELLADSETPNRCRDVARREFDLVSVGWTRYRALYEELIGRAGTTPADSRSAGRPEVGPFWDGPHGDPS